QRFARNSPGQLWLVPPSWRRLACPAPFESAYKLDKEKRTTEREIRSLRPVTEPKRGKVRSFDPRCGRETTADRTTEEPLVLLQQSERPTHKLRLSFL